MKKWIKKRIAWIIPLATCIVALIIGASFHGYRMHPDNMNHYQIGVSMGISMASLAGVGFVLFIIFYLIYRKRK